MITHMDSRYGASYRGSVVNVDDPLQQNRIQVVVPEVYGGGDPVWALASLTGEPLPQVGDTVWVSFEHGDTQHPVWSYEQGADAQGGESKHTRGYIGKYRARVVNVDDPMMERRLQVHVPELDQSYVWARAGSGVDDVEVPAVDAEVWIEYEYGDPEYPVWVGVS